MKLLRFFLAMLAIVIIGGALSCCVGGWLLGDIAQWSLRAQPPHEAELGDIELGVEPRRKTLKIGRHYQLFLYAKQQSNSRWVYPVVSENHAYVQELKRLEGMHGGFHNIPKEQQPELTDYHLLVETDEYDSWNTPPAAPYQLAESAHGELGESYESSLQRVVPVLKKFGDPPSLAITVFKVFVLVVVVVGAITFAVLEFLQVIRVKDPAVPVARATDGVDCDTAYMPAWMVAILQFGATPMPKPRIPCPKCSKMMPQTLERCTNCNASL